MTNGTLVTNNMLAQAAYGLQGAGSESGTKAVARIRLFPGNADVCIHILFCFRRHGFFQHTIFPGNYFCGRYKTTTKDPGANSCPHFPKSSESFSGHFDTREGEGERESAGGYSGASNEHLAKGPHGAGFSSPWCACAPP